MHRDKYGAIALNSYIYICSLLHLVKERIAYVALHRTIRLRFREIHGQLQLRYHAAVFMKRWDLLRRAELAILTFSFPHTRVKQKRKRKGERGSP